MSIDDYDFRPITFQGVTFPATLMALTVFGSVLEIEDEEADEWLWRFPICCGIEKRDSACACARCARHGAKLLLEHRQEVLEGIQERLVPHGFDPESTYRDWLFALQSIADVSDATNGDCVWSAPSHPRDSIHSAADVQRFLDGLDKAHVKALLRTSRDPNEAS